MHFLIKAMHQPKQEPVISQMINCEMIEGSSYGVLFTGQLDFLLVTLAE